ncbi:MAG: hypothetical protein WKF70_11340 [Chitinophagaceae bacterium]
MHKLFPLAALVLLFVSCSKSDPLQTGTISEYYPLKVGKYAIYTLDSTLYVSFGQVKETHSNIIKDIVDESITDNLGRPSYRIRRMLRDKADTSKWVDHATYLVTPTVGSLELIEDNLRFIKLQLPIRDYLTWNGNRYLPEEAFPQYGFNSTAHSRLDTWQYNYENVNSSSIINGKIFDSTITVSSTITDSTGFPPVNINGPAFKTIWQEKYAKGVGLISRAINLEEFQPRSNTYPNGYYSGFAIKQILVEHN